MTTRSLEAHYLAGGNVPNVVRALIAANRADIPLSYKRAAAIDLAGRNVLEAVQTSVNPKVIPCPDPTQGRQTIDGVAKNGIQLKVKAKVTVRTNIDRLVGGATDETIIARVGEGIVNAIGSADTHNQVLEKPDSISKRVLEKGLDAGTAYEILSIDIADIDVGDNIGANLQAAPGRGRHPGRPRQGRGAAGLRRRDGAGDARRTSRRTAPRSSLAEAEVPLAIAEAFRKGNLGITDYYHLRNIQADTEMRSAIAGTGNSRREPSTQLIRTVGSAPQRARSGINHDAVSTVSSSSSSRLTFLAIWALTSLFNREAPPLPQRTGRPQPPGGPGSGPGGAVLRSEALNRDPSLRWAPPAAADRPVVRRPRPVRR